MYSLQRDTRVGNCKNCDIILEENIIRIDIGNNQTHLVYGYYDDAMAMECLEFINDQRVNHTTSKELIGDEWVEKEVLPLETNDSEMMGAKIRAAELTYLYSHTRPNSQRKWNEYFHGGENIVHGAFSAFDAFDVWMRSEGHAANIIRSAFGYTGIAVFWESRIDPDTRCIFYYPNWVNGFTYADYYETQHN